MTKVTVVMITKITKIRKTVTITEKKNDYQATIKTETIIGNTNFKTELVSTIKGWEIIKIHMFARNSIYPLPLDGALSAHINGDHDHVSRYKSYCEKDKLG